jgi:hypothetical protein
MKTETKQLIAILLFFACAVCMALSFRLGLGIAPFFFFFIAAILNFNWLLNLSINKQ